MAVTEIWHNPRCSKSRQTLALLEDRGISPQVRFYLDDAPDVAGLRDVAARLGKRAIEMMRTKEALFKELGLAKTDSDDRLFAAMAAHPKLIERPIVLHEGKAAIGRPPESVLDIF